MINTKCLIYGIWFPQIVDRGSGNLYTLYPPFLCSNLLSQGWGGVILFLLKTILSHFMLSSHFMLFPILCFFLDNKFFVGYSEKFPFTYWLNLEVVSIVDK